MKPVIYNSADKQALTLFAAAAGFLDQSLDGIRHIPAKAKADMRRAKSFAWRAVGQALQPLDEKTKKQLLNIVKDTTIGVVSKRQANEWKDATDMYVGGKEYVHRMAEITMEAKCRTCDGTCRNSCPLYESYVHFDVPTLDNQHPNCPYSMQ